MIRYCVPLGQVILKWGQVKTEIYLPTGQVSFNFFPALLWDCRAVDITKINTKRKKTTILFYEFITWGLKARNSLSFS